MKQKWTKKVLPLLMTVAMLLSMVPMAYAEESSVGVAEVNGTEYATLGDAISAAYEHADTVTLLSDITLDGVNSTITTVGWFTLDLAGHTIDGGSNQVFTCLYGTVVIKDSSAYQTGIITTTADTAISVSGTDDPNYTNTVEIQGGTIHSSNDAVYVNSYATAKISGGVLDGRVFASGSSTESVAKIDITGGTVNGTIWAQDYSNVTISGTDTLIKDWVTIFDEANGGHSTALISGGKFTTQNPQAYLAAGKQAPWDEYNGYYCVEYIPQPVAQISSNTEIQYYSIEDAISNLTNDGQTIKLIADVASPAIIDTDKTFTLDLATYSISSSDQNNPAVTINNGTVTIQKTLNKTAKIENTAGGLAMLISGGSVEMKSGVTVTSSGVAMYVCDAGKFTLTSGTVSSENDCAIYEFMYPGATAAPEVTIGTSGKVVSTGTSENSIGIVIEGCDSDELVPKLTVNRTSSSTSIVAVSGGTCGISGHGASGKGNTKITIASGIVEGGTIGIYHPQAGQLTLTGGEVRGKTGIYAKSGTVTVPANSTVTVKGTGEKGTYEFKGSGCVSTGDALVLENCSYPGGLVRATIAGGTFTSTSANAVAAYAQTDYSAPTGFLTGGIFSNEPAAEYIAEGYEAKQNSGTTYIVVPTDSVAVVGMSGYSTLTDAITAAQSLTTTTKEIKLIDDVTIATDETITFDATKGSFRLDLNGHNLTGNGTLQVTATKSGSPNLKIMNSNEGAEKNEIEPNITIEKLAAVYLASAIYKGTITHNSSKGLTLGQSGPTAIFDGPLTGTGTGKRSAYKLSKFKIGPYERAMLSTLLSGYEIGEENGYFVYYQPKSLSITLNPQEGTFATPWDPNKTGGLSITVPYEKDGGITRDGYVFQGWYTQPNGEGDCVVSSGSKTLTVAEQEQYSILNATTNVYEMTLYAYWLPVVATLETANGNIYKYTSVSEAVLDAGPNATIRLQKDWDMTTAPVSIPSQKIFTLDLNGKTVTTANASSAEDGCLYIPAGTKLTLVDSSVAQPGKICSATDYVSGKYYPAVNVYGTFVMESGIIDTARSSKETAQVAIGVYNTGTVIINGGEIKAGNYAIAGNGTNQASSSTITITNGTVSSAHSTAIYHPQNGTLTISGGTITGKEGVQMCSGSLIIKGSPSITATGTDALAAKTGDGSLPDGAAVSVVNRSYPGGTPSANISGTPSLQAANGEKALRVYTWTNTDTTNNTPGTWGGAKDYVSLSGGTFSSDPSVYVAAGYGAFKLNETTWKVSKASTVTFDANGGTVTPTSKEVTFGATYGPLPTPTREHFRFDGWKLNDTTITEETVVTTTEGHALVAQWTRTTDHVEPKVAAYQVEHYQENLDGTYTLAETEFPLYGELGSEVTAVAKNYAHYAVDTGIEGTKTSGIVVMPSVPDGATAPVILTLKLYYKLDTFTVSYDSQNDTDMVSQTVKYGASVEIPSAPTKADHTFTGWKLGNTIYQPTDVSGERYTVAGDVTFTAQWNKIVVKPDDNQKPAEVEKVEVASGKAESTVSPELQDNADANDVSDLLNGAEAVKEEGLSEQTSAVTADTQSIQAAASAGQSALQTQEPVTIVVETYLDIQVTDVKEENGKKTVTLDITPMYQLKATTDSSNMVEEGDQKNTVNVGEPQKLVVKPDETNPVIITLPVPSAFDGVDNLYVKHDSELGIFYYVPDSDALANGQIKFENKHGFSEFTLISDARK